MARSEHLQWCKDRALEYVEQDDLNQAFASMASDMSKHPETACPKLTELGFRLLWAGHLDTATKMEKWINGFN